MGNEHLELNNEDDHIPVIQIGNPLLRLTSSEVLETELGTHELQMLINSLFKIMEIKGGIGIAAPQIGINKRIIVFGMNSHPLYSETSSIPYTVLINPKVIASTNETEERYEGCLSVGTLRGKVNRFKKIYYKGFDLTGKLIEREVEGLHARVVQHECDHLDGILFTDKISDQKSLGFHQELVASGEVKTQAFPKTND